MQEESGVATGEDPVRPIESSGERNTPTEWFFLVGNRMVLAAGLLVAVFGLLTISDVVWGTVGVDRTRPLFYLFGGLIGGNFTLVTNRHLDHAARRLAPARHPRRATRPHRVGGRLPRRSQGVRRQRRGASDADGVLRRAASNERRLPRNRPWRGRRSRRRRGQGRAARDRRRDPGARRTRPFVTRTVRRRRLSRALGGAPDELLRRDTSPPEAKGRSRRRLPPGRTRSSRRTRRRPPADRRRPPVLKDALHPERALSALPVPPLRGRARHPRAGLLLEIYATTSAAVFGSVAFLDPVTLAITIAMAPLAVLFSFVLRLSIVAQRTAAITPFTTEAQELI